MRANCFKCGAGFRFDEAKVGNRAVVRCPMCSTRILLQQDPNSPEPHYFVSPFKTAQKRPVTSGGQNNGLVANKSDPPATKNPVVKEEVKLPPMIGEEELEGNGHADKASLQNNNKDSFKQENKQSSEILQLQNDGDAPVKKREMIVKASDQSQVISAKKSETATHESPRFTPVPKRNSSGMRTALLFIVVLIVLGFSFYAVVPKFLNSYSPDEKKSLGTENHPGKLIIQELAKKFEQKKGDSLQFTKDAEMAFSEDTEAGYRKALQGFRNALMMDQDNAELIARYVESYLLVHKNPNSMKKIQDLINLTNYGFRLDSNLASLHRASARLYLALNQLQKAQDNARMARKLEPNNIENLIVLAETLVKTDPEQSVDLLEDSVHGPQPYLAAIRPLADAYRQLGRYAAAEEAYRRRDSLDKGSCTLCGDYASLLETVGEYEKSGEIFERLAQANINSAEGLIGMAREKWLSGAPIAEAQEIFEGLQDPESLNPYIKKEKIDLLINQSHYALLSGDWEKASAYAKQAESLDPNDPFVAYHVILTTALLDKLNPALWIDIQKRLDAIELDLKEYPEMYMLWGLCASKMGDLKTAMMKFQMAFRIGPEFYHAPLFLASLYTQANNFEDAMTEIEKLGRFSPDYWRTHQNHNLLTDVYDYEEKLLEVLEGIDEHSVDRDRKQKSIGIAAYLLGKTDLAIEKFTLVLKNSKNDIKSNLFLSFSYIKKEDWSAARKAASEILTIKSTHPDATYAFCKILGNQNRRTEAIDRLKRAIAVHSQSEPLLSLLSIMSYEEGIIDQARSLAILAYQTDSDSLDARRARYLARK